MTYRGKPFPITGTLEEMIGLLGPYTRHEGYFYFWDSLGLKVNLVRNSRSLVSGIDLYLDREESSSEIGLKLSGRPEDLEEVKEIRATYPWGFFKGEFVLEGAVIDSLVDFGKVNESRQAYLQAQSGPDTQLQPIRESWSSTRYAFTRDCADGKNLGMIFTLISSEPPLRLQTISIGSNTVPDSVEPSTDPVKAPHGG
jgi:hypothetical protein